MAETVVETAIPMESSESGTRKVRRIAVGRTVRQSSGTSECAGVAVGVGFMGFGSVRFNVVNRSRLESLLGLAATQENPFTTSMRIRSLTPIIDSIEALTFRGSTALTSPAGRCRQ